jgi:hypothetical protein
MPGLAPDLQLWKFTRWLQSATLTPAQEAHIVAHLQATAEANPQLAPFLERTVKAVQALTLGKVAPEIEGNDPDGIGFRLSDYRGRVVVLTFGGSGAGSAAQSTRTSASSTTSTRIAVRDPERQQRRADVKAARRGATDRPFISRAWWDGYGEGQHRRPDRGGPTPSTVGRRRTCWMKKADPVRSICVRKIC